MKVQEAIEVFLRVVSHERPKQLFGRLDVCPFLMQPGQLLVAFEEPLHSCDIHL